MKFYEWLRRQRYRQDAVGDIARDTFWDTQAPKQSEDPAAWRAYIKKRGLPRFVTAFETAWEEFLQYSS